MTMTSAQLQERIQDLEVLVNKIMTMLQGVATRNELGRLITSRQALMDSMEERLSALETRVSNISIGLQ